MIDRWVLFGPVFSSCTLYLSNCGLAGKKDGGGIWDPVARWLEG